MGNTITINIYNNCGCPSGANASPDSPLDGIIYPELVDEEFDGPPHGYLEPNPGAITDRQCKVAKWLVKFLNAILDYLINTVPGGMILAAISTIPGGTLGGTIAKLLARILVPALSTIITAVFTFFGTPGFVLDDVILTPLALIVSTSIVLYITKETVVKNFTAPNLQAVLTELQAHEDELLCALAQATSPADAKEAFEKSLAGWDLSTTQRFLAIPFLPPQLISLLFYTADWWPSFDDLLTMEGGCCGDFIPGGIIGPGSQVQCQAASWLVDMLAETYDASNAFLRNLSYLNINPFNNDTAYLYDRIIAELSIPPKIRDKAASYSQFVAAVASYANETGYGTYGPAASYFGETALKNIADELRSQRSTIRTALMAATTEQGVYEAIYNPLDTYIAATYDTDDPDSATHLRKSIQTLMSPNGSLPALMFEQDPEVMRYALAECTQGSGVVDFQFSTDLEGWYLVPTYPPPYPTNSNAEQTLVWGYSNHFSSGAAIAGTGSGGSCYISSPSIGYYIDPLKAHDLWLNWHLNVSTISYQLALVMNDTSRQVVYQHTPAFPNGTEKFNLDALSGQTIDRIEISFGAASGTRILEIDYCKITSTELLE